MTLSREFSSAEPVVLFGKVMVTVLEPEKDLSNWREVEISTVSSFFWEHDASIATDDNIPSKISVIFLNNAVTSFIFKYFA